MDQVEMAEKVGKLYTDMYLGDGPQNPPVTTRLALNEKAIEVLTSNLNKGLWLLAASAVAGIGNLIMHALHL